MSVGISIVDKPALEHFIIRGLNSGHKVSWCECRLLSLSMEVLRVSI